MEAVKSAAENGNDDHQLNCYGLGTLFIFKLCFYFNGTFFYGIKSQHVFVL